MPLSKTINAPVGPAICTREPPKIETKNADKQESTVSTETKRQEPLRIEKTHKDGITYIQEQYLQYQIKYLAMDKKVISEEKVKEFINTNGIKKKFFANLLGISVAKLSAMLQGKRKMKADELIIFSEYFNLKSDFFADVNYLQECN